MTNPRQGSELVLASARQLLDPSRRGQLRAVDPDRTMPALEAQQRQLLAAGDLAIAFLDGCGRVEYLNPTATAWLGRSASEAIGRPCAAVFQLIDPTRQPLDPMATHATGASAPLAPSRAQLCSRDGESRDVVYEIFGAAIGPAGDHGFVLVCRDAAAEQGPPGPAPTPVRELSPAQSDTAALTDWDRQISTLLQNLEGTVYRCQNDDAWTVQWISDGCRKLFGYGPDDLIGNRVIALGDLIHPDDAGPLLTKCQHNLERRIPCSNEYRIRTATGAEKWVWDQAQGVYSATGELLFIDGILVDITERKLTEARLVAAQTALRRSERMFRALLEHSTDGVAIFAPDGKALYHSPSAERITGYTHAELMERGALGFTHPEDLAATGASFAKVTNEPGSRDEVLFRILHKTGRVVWVEGSARNMIVDPDVGGIVVNYRDVTERVVADRNLRQSEERLRLALASAHQGIYDLNLVTGEALVTPEYATMLGYDPATFHEPMTRGCSDCIRRIAHRSSAPTGTTSPDDDRTTTSSSASAPRTARGAGFCRSAASWSARLTAGRCACSAPTPTSPNAS